MPTVSIYQAEDNKTYQVSVDINSSILDMVDGSPSNCQTDYYLKITTTLKKAIDNSSHPIYIIRTLSDVPTGYLPASTFTELVDYYVEYFINQAELGKSSSSSESSPSSSSYGYSESSSSSSYGYSESSSSSSSVLG
jgi:hypothetical protein